MPPPEVSDRPGGLLLDLGRGRLTGPPARVAIALWRNHEPRG